MEVVSDYEEVCVLSQRIDFTMQAVESRKYFKLDSCHKQNSPFEGKLMKVENYWEGRPVTRLLEKSRQETMQGLIQAASEEIYTKKKKKTGKDHLLVEEAFLKQVFQRHRVQVPVKCQISEIKITLPKVGNTREDTGQRKKKDDEFAFKHVEFKIQIKEVIQCAVCIYIYRTQKKIQNWNYKFGSWQQGDNG